MTNLLFWLKRKHCIWSMIQRQHRNHLDLVQAWTLSFCISSFCIFLSNSDEKRACFEFLAVMDTVLWRTFSYRDASYHNEPCLELTLSAASNMFVGARCICTNDFISSQFAVCWGHTVQVLTRKEKEGQPPCCGGASVDTSCTIGECKTSTDCTNITTRLNQTCWSWTDI